MTDEAMSPWRRRMIEDMTIRKFAPKTQHDYPGRLSDAGPWRARHRQSSGRHPKTFTLPEVGTAGTSKPICCT